MALAGRKVLLLAADLFEDMELLYPLYRLREEGRRGDRGRLDHPVMGKKGHGPVLVDTVVDDQSPRRSSTGWSSRAATRRTSCAAPAVLQPGA